MHRILSTFGSAAVFLLLFTQCFTYNLQTARTTPKGEVSAGLGGSVLLFTEPDAFLPALGYGGAMVRYGISDRMDIGVQGGVFMAPTVDVKYRYVGTNESPWAVSTGISLGGFADRTGQSIIQTSSLNVASYYPNDWLAITTGIRPVVSFISSTPDISGQATLGFRFGRTWGFTVEGGALVNSIFDTPNVTPSASIGISRGF